jgi:hypothetical protein
LRCAIAQDADLRGFVCLEEYSLQTLLESYDQFVFKESQLQLQQQQQQHNNNKQQQQVTASRGGGRQEVVSGGGTTSS